MSSESNAVNLALKNDADELSVVSAEVDAFAANVGLAEEHRFAMQLCLEEVLMYIINFGYEDIDEHEIQVTLSTKDDGSALLMQIVDDGSEYDPTAGGQGLDLDEMLDSGGLSDLGFHLVEEYVDDIDYKRDNEQNILILTRNL